MRILLFAALIAVAGCARIANSPINPFNWFGRSAEVVGAPAQPVALRPLVRPGDVANVVDLRVPVERVDELTIERTATGGVVRATGTAATQGFYNAQLVPIAQSGGTVVYEFRVETPPGPRPQGAEATRRIAVATELSAGELAGVSTVRVQGRTNAREARR